MSQSYALNVTTKLWTEECCNCHMIFAMPEDFRRRRLEEGGNFCCPQGHSQCYTETQVQKLKRELEATYRRLEITTQTAKTAVMLRTKAENQNKRLKKRIQNGVCPHCNRTFLNVARHMETKHPGESVNENHMGEFKQSRI